MCDRCEGDLIYMGRLGGLDWCRCRNCGWEQAEQADEMQELDGIEASDLER